MQTPDFGYFEGFPVWFTDTEALSRIGERFAHIGIEGAVAGKQAAVRAAMHSQ